TNVVDTPPNKDDNGAVIETVSQTTEPVKTEGIPVSNTQTPVKSSNFSSGEQTAQMVGNEPFGKETLAPRNLGASSPSGNVRGECRGWISFFMYKIDGRGTIFVFCI
ncbi:MAG: hypothetical protein AAB465_00975, partial [Patescibacteria group bacterium]